VFQELIMKSNAKPSKLIQTTRISLCEEPRGEGPKAPVPPPHEQSLLRSARSSEEFRPRMYTEEEVAAIIRVSLSQLRKWRMKGNARRVDGPPFKKIGRMVRYPANALNAYINCEDEG
jgi:hypothetical protein